MCRLVLNGTEPYDLFTVVVLFWENKKWFFNFLVAAAVWLLFICVVRH